MSELIRDGGDDLIGVGGNNGELVGCLGTFDNVISGKVGNKAVGDAEGDGLIVRISALGIDEKRLHNMVNQNICRVLNLEP